MSQLLWANNANTTLAGAITNTALTLNVQAGAGALFPNPGTGQHFVATLLDEATQTIREIIWVTARSGDVFTVVRAQEGTSAVSWLAGDFIANQLTAGQLNSFQQGSPTFPDTAEIYYGVDVGVADSMVVTTNPSISSYVDGMVFEVTPANTNLTATPGVNICTLGIKTFANALPGYIVAGQKLFFSYDGALGKMVLITLPNTATTTMRGIGRTATLTEGAAGVTTGSVPGWMTPEDVAAYVTANPAPPGSLPVATTTTRGITRIATTAEAKAFTTSGTVPAAITPEDLGAALSTPTIIPLPIGAIVIAMSADGTADIVGVTVTSSGGGLITPRGARFNSNPTYLPDGQTWLIIGAIYVEVVYTNSPEAETGYVSLTTLMRTA